MSLFVADESFTVLSSRLATAAVNDKGVSTKIVTGGTGLVGMLKCVGNISGRGELSGETGGEEYIF
jgi:hypothetical protein